MGEFTLILLMLLAPSGQTVRVVNTADVAYETGHKAYAKDDYPEAFNQFQLACNHSHGQGCFMAARIAMSRVTVYATADMAPPLLEAGCKAKHGEACNMLGQGISDGWIPGDTPAATANFAAACKLKFAAGCMNEGKRHEGMFRGTVNKKAARKAYNAACKLGELKGCDMRDRVAGKKGAD